MSTVSPLVAPVPLAVTLNCTLEAFSSISASRDYVVAVETYSNVSGVTRF